MSLRAVELPQKQIPRGKAARNDKAYVGGSPLIACPEQIPHVEITWKCCGTHALTGLGANDMFNGFRGQPDSL